MGAHIFFSVSERHASVQSAVLEAPQETVIHQNVQDGRHLTEDENLENHDHVTRQPLIIDCEDDDDDDALLMCSYLMSLSLQSRQHSVQNEKFPRALHQLFIDLWRFERHTGG